MTTESDNGWESSTGAWVRLMDAGEFNRTRNLDPAMLRMCGPVKGLRILDVGCGEGRFCRMLTARGGETIGLDPTGNILQIARERHPEGQYIAGGGEKLPFADCEFDAVISFLSLVDIEDYQAAIAEMARVCRPGGFLAIANLNGFASGTIRGWQRDEHGEKIGWTFDHYMQERWTWAEWAGIRIKNYHRPLSAYLQAFLAQGLILEHFEETQPGLSEEEVAADPFLARQKAENARMPDFLVMRWRKRA